MTVHEWTVRSPLNGCQVTSRPRELISRYSKWPDTFRTALLHDCLDGPQRRPKNSHFVVCLTTGPWSLPKRVLHRVRASASLSSFQYLVVCPHSLAAYIFFLVFPFQFPISCLPSFTSCLRLLSRLHFPVSSILSPLIH